jgi:hypothetical protein
MAALFVRLILHKVFAVCARVEWGLCITGDWRVYIEHGHRMAAAPRYSAAGCSSKN